MREGVKNGRQRHDFDLLIKKFVREKILARSEMGRAFFRIAIEKFFPQ